MSVRLDKDGTDDRDGTPLQQPTVEEGPHLPTVVWGLVLLAVPVLVVLREVTEIRVDLGLVVPLGMLAMGGLLVAAALLGLVRGRRS